MEALTRLVADSLARHGFDRPVDFRRLQWSRWFRCDSQHSLLYVPSKPGVFALAEEIISGDMTADREIIPVNGSNREGHDFSRAEIDPPSVAALAAEVQRMSMAPAQPKTEARHKRMLAVTQFFEADDMAFTLDRMLSRPNPMRARLESGRYFIRFVVIEDSLQRHTVASALNQWIASAAEKATGLGAHFASSLELTPATESVSVGRAPAPANAGGATLPASPQMNSGAAINIHNPPVFPSGF
jgi:hypothetical protein